MGSGTSRTLPKVGLMLALEPDFLVATTPLFEEGLVDAVSLSVDFLWRRAMPGWANELALEYAARGALYGHAIHFSILSSRETPENDRWLVDFAARTPFLDLRLVSAHFGLGLAPGFRRGAPLPLPFTTSTLAAGRSWLRRLERVTRASGKSAGAVGLENLALAFSREECLSQGAFLHALLCHDERPDESEPRDRFLTLDLHNVFCQAVNFDLDPRALVASYPLDLVRELHVSGGSIGRSPAEPDRDVRQDTHDGDVPREVLDLVRWTIARTPNLEAVFFERLGDTIGLGHANADRAASHLRDDYAALRRAVAEGVASPAASASPAFAAPLADTPDDHQRYERLLVETLFSDDSRDAPAAPAAMRRRLIQGAPEAYRAGLERAELRMVDLGSRVVREWFLRATP